MHFTMFEIPFISIPIDKLHQMYLFMVFGGMWKGFMEITLYFFYWRFAWGINSVVLEISIFEITIILILILKLIFTLPTQLISNKISPKGMKRVLEIKLAEVADRRSRFGFTIFILLLWRALFVWFNFDKRSFAAILTFFNILSFDKNSVLKLALTYNS